MSNGCSRKIIYKLFFRHNFVHEEVTFPANAMLARFHCGACEWLANYAINYTNFYKIIHLTHPYKMIKLLKKAQYIVFKGRFNTKK